MKLAGFSYIYNGVDHDIPFVESIESVISVVDQFVLVECNSTDNTLELCRKLKAKYPEKIKLLNRDWVKHFTEINIIANWASLFIDKSIDCIFQLQSDEVIHERDLPELKELPERMLREGKTAASWSYHHFLGGPTITFPFCYSKLVRVVMRGRGWRIIGDGVQYDKDLKTSDEVLDSSIHVFHYGKMKSPEKGFKKEVSFQNLYTDIGFPDPKMGQMREALSKDYCDYVYLFKDHIINNTINKFTGTHPSVMKSRINLFRDSGYEQFLSAVDKTLKIDI